VSDPAAHPKHQRETPSLRAHVAVIVPLVVVAVALGLRLIGLANIPGPYWDEITYVADADAYLGTAPPHYRPGHPVPQIAEGTWMQPPAGKWAIAAGEAVFGHGDRGYRSAAVIAGTAGVLLTYFIALELWGSVLAAGLAAALLALDGLHLVQSRMAMLDIFLSTFVLGAVLCVVRARRDSARPSPAFNGLVTRDEIRAGALFGLAIAVKWSAIPFLVVGAAAAWWLVGPRRSQWSLQRRLASAAVAFVITPAIAYLISYLSFFTQHGLDIPGFLRLQRAMLSYGAHFHTNSTYQSAAWTWPFLGGAVEYAHDRFLQGGVRIVAGQVRVVRVLAIGNPAVWWGFLLAAPYLALKARVNSRRGHGNWQAALIIGMYLAGWLPWLVSSRTRFSYYLLPSVPFACLAIAAAVVATERAARRYVAAGALAMTVVAAALYFPVWTGQPLSLHDYLRLTHLPGVKHAVKASAE